MRRFFKIIIGFVALIILAIGAAYVLIPKDRVVALATDQVRAATGRELALTGDVAPSIWPVLGVRTGPVTFSNADWGAADHLVSAEAAEIGVELMPLISGEVKVAALRLVDPVVSLEVNEQGLGNWVFDKPAGSGASGDGSDGVGRELPKIALPEAVIKNGTIRFTDARSGQRIELSELDLQAGLSAVDAPLTLEGSGIWNGARASLDALIDTPAAIIEGRNTSVKLALASDPANLSFEGNVQAGPGAPIPLIDGALAVDVANPAEAMAWASGAAAPAGLREIGAVKLDATVAATQDALDVTAKGSVGYKGRAVRVDLDASGDAGWSENQAFAVAASGRADGLFTASFSGPVSMGGTPAVSGPVNVQISDLRAFAEWASGNALNAPPGTFESAGVKAGLSMRGERIDLSGLEMTLDQTRLSGDAAVDLGGRPYLSANLNSGPLDLTPFMGGDGSGGGSGGGSSGGAQGWSTEPLDLSALRDFDADLAIRAEAVDLGEIEIGRSDIDARLRDGRLDMRIDRVDAYGGGLSGDIVLIAGDQAEVVTDLTVSQVQLRPLLQALAGFESLEGIGAFRINARGRGSSMDQLMHSLDGNGGLDLSDGAILGVNLAAMVRNLTGQTGGVQRTDFSAVTGTFDITDGVLHNSDFSFLGPLLRVVGAGTVDLGAQTQNFRLEPTAVASLTGQGGALGDSGLGVFPVLITGTWSNPKIRPDLTAAIEGFLSDPERTIGTVGDLVKDPGKAVGTLLGQGGGGDKGQGGVLGQVLEGALGGRKNQGGDRGADRDDNQSDGGAASPTEQVLGNILGGGSGQDRQSDGTVAQPTHQPESGSGGVLGTVLGALGGNRGDQPAPIPQVSETEETVPQPTYDPGNAEAGTAETGSAETGTAETGAQTEDLTGGPTGGTEFAPALAPYPRPAPRTAALDQGSSLPSRQFEPEAEPEPQRPAEILQDILQPDQQTEGGEAPTEGRRDKKRLKVKDLLKVLQ